MAEQELRHHDLCFGCGQANAKGLQLTAGINNVFDEDPPLCTSCLLNGYEPQVYDMPGSRFWYVRMDIKW